MAASKKWKYTVRVLTGRTSCTLGHWLDQHGIQSKYTRCGASAGGWAGSAILRTALCLCVPCALCIS